MCKNTPDAKVYQDGLDHSNEGPADVFAKIEGLVFLSKDVQLGDGKEGLCAQVLLENTRDDDAQRGKESIEYRKTGRLVLSKTYQYVSHPKVTLTGSLSRTVKGLHSMGGGGGGDTH